MTMYHEGQNPCITSLLGQLFLVGGGRKKLITFILNIHPITQQIFPYFLTASMPGTLLGDEDTMERGSLPSELTV